MMHRRMGRAVVIGALLAGATFFGVQGTGQTGPQAHEFTLVTAEISGVVFWLPSVIVVHPGERVVLHLINGLPAVHGLSIDDYGIHAVAWTAGSPDLPSGGVSAVTFIAKAGQVSRFYCQFHRSQRHIGGQIVVL